MGDAALDAFAESLKSLPAAHRQAAYEGFAKAAPEDRPQIARILAEFARNPKAAAAAQEQTRLVRWKADPVVFAEEVFGYFIYDKQADYIRDLAFESRVAAVSGHKTGKLLHPDTPIPTPSGMRRYGDLRVGDEVFSDTGCPCRIVGEVHWKNRPLMRVHFADGTWVDADEKHEWVVHTHKSRKRTWHPAVTVETHELLERLTVPNGRGKDGKPRQIPNFTVDLPGPLQLPRRDLPLDPYVLGAWLGDGTSAGASITGLSEICGSLAAAGCAVGRRTPKKNNRAAKIGIGKATARPHLRGHRNDVTDALRTLGVLNNKHVPNEYLWASKEQRLALLQGLMDTDGHCDKRHRLQFCNTNKQLADSVLFLVRSLGIKARIHEKRATLYGRDMGPKWHVEWGHPLAVFRLPRKLARLRTSWTQKANAHRRMAVVNVERLPDHVDSKCIEVDSPSHLYLCGESMVPTHNSMSYAIVAWWDAHLHGNARVILTSASSGQVDAILWREIVTLWHKAADDKRWDHTPERPSLKPKFKLTPEEPPGLAQTGIHLANGSEIWGFTTDKRERIAGISGGRLLFLVDEASGYPDDFFEALVGNCMGGNARIGAASQGTKQTGWFYDAFHKKKHIWKTHEMSCYDTPNARAGRVIVSGLASLESIELMKEDFGEDSEQFRIRALGKFPSGSSDAVISRDLVNAGVARWKEVALVDGVYVGDKSFLDDGEGPLVLGVDIARFGDDDTTVTPVRGLRTGTTVTRHGFDTVDVAELAAETARELRRPHERVIIRIDTTGGLGAGPADALRRLRTRHGLEEFDVVDMNYSENARNDKCFRLRDELWWGGRQALKAGAMIPPNPKLERELSEPTYRTRTEDGRIKVESKDEMKKRLKRSPDTADGWLQAVYDPDAYEGRDMPPTYDNVPTNIRLPMSVGVQGF